MNYKPCKKLVLLFLFAGYFSIIISLPNTSADKGLLWQTTNGGSGKDEVYSSIITSDGYLVLVGTTDSWTETHSELYIQKLDSKGELVWELSFGEAEQNVQEDDIGFSIIEAHDGNYLITGLTAYPESIGDDLLLMKVSKDGQILWHKEYGENAWDWGSDLLELPDRTIIVVGTSQEFAMGYYDFYLIKTDPNGNEIWHRAYRLQGQNYATSIISGNEGGFMILGTTEDTGGADTDILLLKVGNNGDIIWTKEYGGENKEKGYDIISCRGSGYYIVGESNNFEERRYDVYLLKINEEGDKVWEKNYGSEKDDNGKSLTESSDGGLFITGQSFQNTVNSSDILLIKINSIGDLEFNETLGTAGYDTGVKTHNYGSNTIYITGNIHDNNMDFGLIQMSMKKYIVNIISEHGNITGSGSYYEGSSPYIEVKDLKVQYDRGTRYLFDGWTSDSPQGYTGNNRKAQINILSDITQIARWRKQYYVEVNAEGEGEIDDINGWYDAGTHLTIQGSPHGENELIRWRGEGKGSYTGSNPQASIIVNGPINQTALFGIYPVWVLTIESEYGEVIGNGTYREGEEAIIKVNQDKIQISPKERAVFNKWVNPQGSGYSGPQIETSFTVLENTTQVASWNKQYYVEFVSNEYGNVPQSGWFDEGASITLKAYPDNDYKLDHWDITSNSQTVSYGSNRYVVNSAVTIEAIIEPIPKPNYTLFFIVGSIGAIPVLAKTWIKIESNLKRKKLAKTEYNNSRGTIHKKMLESVKPKLRQEINELLEIIKSRKGEKNRLKRDKQSEIEKAASSYLFERNFTEIPGIGNKLKDRVRSQVFDGTLDSLYHCSWVEGIGDAKSAEIRYWVRNQQKRLSGFISKGFTGKKEIENNYDSKINQVEIQIQNYKSKVEPLQNLESEVLSELSRLNQVDVSTFLKSFDGNVEASNIVTEYHLGIFPEWGRMPTWFKTCMEDYS